MITSPSTGANSKAWDFVDTYTPINAWVPKNIVVVNQRTFDRLDETVQAAVLAAAAEAESRGWEMSKAEAEEKTAVMQENGMTIATPTPELVAGLQAIGEEMLAKWKEEAGEDALAILDAYQAE